MQRELEQSLNDLLVRWHRWSSAPARVADTLMQDFDAVLARVPEPFRTTLYLQARNLAGGAQVWSTARSTGDIGQARILLHNLLADDERRWFGPRIVYLNERGNRIGESNPRAQLSNHDVELLLQLREEGFSYSWLAQKFECSKSAVQWYCNGGRRCQVPARVKAV